jgi:D-alanyl-lipoteichoic acid acyltransferase DltB (MBOAT superfamily)
MPQQNFSLLKDVVGYVHMKIDYARLFEGIDLSNNENLNVNTTSDNAKQVVQTIKKNIPNMFIYEN